MPTTHLTQEDILFLLYRACTLFAQRCEGTPDWVRIISGANPAMLAEAVEIAKEEYTLDETGEI